jgi:hypothetical protein
LLKLEEIFQSSEKKAAENKKFYEEKRSQLDELV